jgi:hypothetical protein
MLDNVLSAALKRSKVPQERASADRAWDPLHQLAGLRWLLRCETRKRYETQLAQKETEVAAVRKVAQLLSCQAALGG